MAEATASRPQMLAMPVATTSDDVIDSSTPAFVKASRPQASANQRARSRATRFPGRLGALGRAERVQGERPDADGPAQLLERAGPVGHADDPRMGSSSTRQNRGMAYFVVLASAFLVVSAATALRPGRRGLFAALAYPVGWAAGELAGQGIVLEGALLALLWWWGWPSTSWLSALVISLAIVVVAENLALIVILFLSRGIVRRAMEETADSSAARTAPARGRLRRLVAHGAAGTPSPARHAIDEATSSTVRWRATDWTSGGSRRRQARAGHPLPPRRAWTIGDKREQGRPMLHEFVRRGWVVVVQQLPLGPASPWPAQIEDVDAGARLGEEEHRELRR